MSYTTELIDKEIDIIKKCLTDWEATEYPEAKKQRERILENLTKSKEILLNNL